MTKHYAPNYKQITLDEARTLEMSEWPKGWLDPDMPRRQYEAVVEKELAAWKAGEDVAPYQALVSLLKLRPLPAESTLLDVGASSGYYSAVLDARGIPYKYYGLDISRHYGEFAIKKFDSLIERFFVADAADLLFSGQNFDIVVTGGTIMHSLQYADIISECKRVARHQVVFHRTPVHNEAPTKYFTKEAYGLPCLEIQFNVDEIKELFVRSGGWEIRASRPVSWDHTTHSGHVSYLLERV